MQAVSSFQNWMKWVAFASLAITSVLLTASLVAGREELKTDLPLMPPGDEAEELMQECALCHFEYFLDFQDSTHNQKQVGCPSCHGEAKGHRETENNDIKPELHFRTEGREKRIEELCSACHVSQLKDVLAGGHNEAPVPESGQPADCLTCHAPHQ